MAGHNRPQVESLSRGVFVIASFVLAVLLIGAGGYGPHRDELYFLAAGENLAWGYPDQGPLTPALAALMDGLAPDSLTVLRLPSALATAATVLLTGLLARELGASKRAQQIAAGTTAVGSVFLITGHLLSTTTFDLLAWTLITLLVVMAVRTKNDRLWLVAGVVLGLALLNKPLPVFLAIGLLAGVAIAGPRGLLRNPWVWAGAGIALAIWSPWLIWQASEGWPQLDVAAELADGSSTSSEPRWAFLPFQALLVSPLLVPIWVAGLWALFRDPGMRDFRFLGWAWVVLAGLFLLTAGKPYYLAGLFGVLIAAGAPKVDRWLDRGRPRARRVALATALGLSAVVSATLALPVLPETSLDPVIAANEDVAETVGWPELTATVAEVQAMLPPDERAVIVTINYGEAGAIDRYGSALGLADAFSGHNGYWDWGPPPDEPAPVIAVGFGRDELVGLLSGCRAEARITNDAEVENEELGRAVYLCDGTAAPWSEIWPEFRRLG